MARDEIILEAFGGSVLDDLESSIYFIEETSRILGETTVQEQARYQQALTCGTETVDPVSVCLVASFHQFSVLKNLLKSQHEFYWRFFAPHDPKFKAILANIRVEFNYIDENSVFDSFIKLLNKAWALGGMDGQESLCRARDIVISLLLRHLCRLLFIFLEAKSPVQWHLSPSRKRAAATFFQFMNQVETALLALNPERPLGPSECVTIPAGSYVSIEEMFHGMLQTFFNRSLTIFSRDCREHSPS